MYEVLTNYYHHKFAHFSFIYQAHIISGTIAFFIGPLQFVRYIRDHDRNLHRLLGKAYILCVLVSSPTGFVISFKTPLVLAAMGTALQSVFWFWVTLLAYLRIRKKHVASHQRWMVRSYALVLTAPILRIYIMILETFTSINYMDNFTVLYPLFVWLSFMPLLAAEICIQTIKRNSNGEV